MNVQQFLLHEQCLQICSIFSLYGIKPSTCAFSIALLKLTQYDSRKITPPKKINTKIFLHLFSAFLFSFAGSFSQLQGFSNKNQSTISQEIIIKNQEMLFIDYGNNFSNTSLMVMQPKLEFSETPLVLYPINRKYGYFACTRFWEIISSMGNTERNILLYNKRKEVYFFTTYSSYQ